MWHEQVIKDPTLTPTAYRYAGLVMHDYYFNERGYSRMSAANAAEALSVSKQAIIEARDLLVARGWLNRIAFTGQKTAQYEITYPNWPRHCVVPPWTPFKGQRALTTVLHVFLLTQSKRLLREEVYQGREDKKRCHKEWNRGAMNDRRLERYCYGEHSVEE